MTKQRQRLGHVQTNRLQATQPTPFQNGGRAECPCMPQIGEPRKPAVRFPLSLDVDVFFAPFCLQSKLGDSFAGVPCCTKIHVARQWFAAFKDRQTEP